MHKFAFDSFQSYFHSIHSIFLYMRKPNIGLLKREKRLLMTREEGKRETFTRHVDLSMMMRIKRAKDKVREKERKKSRDRNEKKTHF